MELAARLEAAASDLKLPGLGRQRVLAPHDVAGVSAAAGVPRWEVEAAALELGLLPLRYVRNMAGTGMEGQARLLRSRVAVVGACMLVERAVEAMADAGIGRLLALVPAEAAEEGDEERLVGFARNRNESTEVQVRPLELRGGNPAAALAGVDACSACLTSSTDEQLLQFACRLARVPVALIGASLDCVQGTTVFPGDAGIARVYRPEHPHLDTERGLLPPARRALLVAGAWMAEQARALVLEREVLSGRLRVADLAQGTMEEDPL